MTLLEITESLAKFDPDHTIYAVSPWTPSSAAIVAAEPQGGGRPSDAVKFGMSYFLEIFVAQEFLQEWQPDTQNAPSACECCERLIGYANKDA